MRRSKKRGGSARQLDAARPGLDDMTLLRDPKPAGIRENLKERLKEKCIYSYIGQVLVAVNPFTWLDLYGEAAAKRFMHVSRLDAPLPHVYAVAESAFRAMSDEEESQCVIISGESGAGKTEASKQIQNYLAMCSSSKGGAEVERVKTVFLESNPLLEAFGNAKTLRNNNSSRFGKYFELLFDRFGTPRGGVVTNYLLEKSRTVKPGRGERNFHAFYQLAASGTKLLRRSKAADYEMLATCVSVDGVDDAEAFRETEQAMKDVGVSKGTQDAAFSVVAACLALGSFKFRPKQVGDAEGNELVDDSSFAQATQLLGLNATSLRTALASRRLETTAPGGKTERYEVPLNPTQACLARDALIKSLYSKLFDALVESVNDALDPPTIGEDDEELLSISVLDIYGFEIFDKNGFEQLSINFVNEKLQQIFIALTLKAEQEEYVSEQIQWKEVKYFNNKIVCELIEDRKPPGVLPILDDICKQMHSRPGRDIDAKFLDTAASCHASHPHFRRTKTGFTVVHYAGDVEYAVDGFAESNRDELRPDLLEVLVESPDLQRFYDSETNVDDASAAAAQGKKNKRAPIMTAGRKIREQCSALVAALMVCEPHYVRCIKSNEDKKPLTCDDARVEHQCKYLGLPENVRVRRAGFAYRTEYHRFLERFKTLSAKTYPAEWTGTDEAGARHIVKAAAALASTDSVVKDLAALGDAAETQFGRTKLFVKKPEVYFALEKARERKLASYASTIARAWRRTADTKEAVQMAKDLSRRYQSFGKRRRASSVDRPYLADYVRDDAAREGLRHVLRHYGDGRFLFADDRVRALRRNQSGGVSFVPRLAALTGSALYLLEKDAACKQRKWQLRRRLELKDVTSLTVSPNADDVVVVKVRGERNVPRANKAGLIKAGTWQKNADVAACPVTGKKFGVTAARRHHCRVSGKIYHADVTETLQAHPDAGWHAPMRIFDALVGLHSTEPLEDVVLSFERRSELVALLLKHTKVQLTSSSHVSLDLSKSPLSSSPAEVEFGSSTSAASEAAAPSVTVEGQRVTLDAPRGVDDAAARAKRERAEERRALREARRAEERERRKQRDAQRDAQRREERRRLLREKKARKAAEREERARAAGATYVPAAHGRRPRRNQNNGKATRAQQPTATYAATNPRAAGSAALTQKQPPPPPPAKKLEVPAELRDVEDFYWQHQRTQDQMGPSTLAELKRAYENGETGDGCLVYADGLTEEWKTIGAVPVLATYLAAKEPKKPPPPPAKKQPPPPPAKTTPSSSTTSTRPQPRPTVSGVGGGANSELAAKLAKRRAAAG